MKNVHGERRSVVAFKGVDGKIYIGWIEYNDNWLEEYKNGGTPALLSICFGERMPDYLNEKMIPEICEYADRALKEGLGISWDEFKKRGMPSYKELMEDQGCEKED